MPKIIDYSTPQGGLRLPSATPDRISTGQEGRGLEAIGQATSKIGLGIVDAVHKRQIQQDLTKSHVESARVRDEVTTQIDESIRSGNVDLDDVSNNLTEKFNEISQGIETNQGKDDLTRGQATLRSQLMRYAAQGKANVEGDKAVENINSFWSSQGSALLKDPSSFKDIVNANKEFVFSLQQSGQLPGNKTEELTRKGEEELAKNAIRGWIDLNPTFAKQRLESDEFSMVGGNLRHQLSGEIDQAIRGESAENERRKRVQADALQKQQLAIQNDFLVKMSEGKLGVKDILKSSLDPFGSGSKDQFIRMLEAENENGGKLKTDPGVFLNLFTRVNLPDGDPNKLSVEGDLNEYLGRGLSYEDLNKLRDEVTGSKTEKGRIEGELRKQLFEVAKGHLSKANPLMGIKDPEGDERMLMFTTFAYDQIKEAQKEGKPISDLLNPKNQNYLGNFIGNYKRTPQEIIRSMSQELQRKKGPAAPGLQETLNGAPTTNLPKPGDLVRGYKYIGPNSNDPADRKNPKNWTKQ